MNFIDFFTSPTSTDILFKLIMSFALSAIIGIEREIVHKPAGIKTHSLICISATLATSLAIYMDNMFPSSNLDISRLPSQVIAGIGFVGAGTIIREGFSVKGITTAASLLAIACVGLAVGAGFYEGAILATIMIFITLCFITPIKNLVSNRGNLVLFSITSVAEKANLSDIEKMFEEKNAELVSLKKYKSNSSKSNILKILVKFKHSEDVDAMTKTLQDLDGIIEINIEKRLNRIDND